MAIRRLRSSDLLDFSERIAQDDNASDVGFRRAQSAVYYAVFHEIAGLCADLLAGAEPDYCDLSAWRYVYRRLDHGKLEKILKECDLFQQSIRVDFQVFAEQLSGFRAKRDRADYEPFSEITRTNLTRDISGAREIIQIINGWSERDRRAFAAYVLLGRPEGAMRKEIMRDATAP